MSEQSTYVVLVESALLVESHLVDVVDCVLLVDAPYRLRLQRTMQRDHATETQVVARMARQLSDEEARRYADYVILNDGAADLNEQIDKVLKHILDGIQMG
jgi:dephospho-CoA kinase